MAEEHGRCGAERGIWLAGVYEQNVDGTARAGYYLLARGTSLFGSREHTSSVLGIRFSQDTFITTDPGAIARARSRLAREMLLSRRHKPGVLALFVHHVPHLNGTGLMTFAISEENRSIQDMTSALIPARNAEEARIRLTAAADQASAAAVRESCGAYLRNMPSVPTDPIAACTDYAVALLGPVTDDFRSFRVRYVGSTCIGLLHADCWRTQPERAARPPRRGLAAVLRTRRTPENKTQG